MFGYKNISTGEWLDKDFQTPHFADIYALIAACYPSGEAFEVIHGDPENWVKTPISDEEIMQVFAV